MIWAAVGLCELCSFGSINATVTGYLAEPAFAVILCPHLGGEEE